jgi:Family of unknown function (DUF5752)
LSETVFVFLGCLEVREILGVEARDERQLLEHLHHVPDESVLSHLCGVLLHRTVLPEAYPNDFALWSATELRDLRLAERLALVDLFDAGSVEAARTELVATVEDHLRHRPPGPGAGRAQPFAFMQSHVVPVPNGHRARTLREFRDALAEVDASALFFHLIEARYRLGRGQGDFAEWIATSLGQPALADALARIDLHVGSLERLRDRHLTLLDTALGSS